MALARSVLQTMRGAAALAAASLAAVAGIALGATRAPATAPAPDPARAAWPALSSARTFLLDDIDEKVLGRWGLAWRSLYPPHRRVAGRSVYASCERTTPLPTSLRSVRVLSVRRTSVAVAGRMHPVSGVAVRTRIELAWYGPRDPIVVTHTFHLVPVRGRWTWLLSPERYELYLHDRCRPQLAA